MQSDKGKCKKIILKQDYKNTINFFTAVCPRTSCFPFRSLSCLWVLNLNGEFKQRKIAENKSLKMLFIVFFCFILHYSIKFN